MSVEERIKIARKVIMELREDARHWPNPKVKWPLTYGFCGLLDYIESGDPEKSLAGDLNWGVQKFIALQHSRRDTQ